MGRGAQGLRHSAPRREGEAEADIIAFTKEQLAAFKCPKAVEFGDLPKTATGKIQKFKLREKEWKGKGKVIMGVEFKGE